MHKIKDLKDHFVIVGFGRMGQALCLTLQYKDVPFVLIENNEDRIHDADALGYLYIRGDAMQEETLLSAGIERAKAETQLGNAGAPFTSNRVKHDHGPDASRRQAIEIDRRRVQRRAQVVQITLRQLR